MITLPGNVLIFLLAFSIKCSYGCQQGNGILSYLELVRGRHFVEVYPDDQDDSNTTPLYFGLMVAPSEDSDYLNTTLTAVRLALDTINDDPDLLGGYSLHYTLTVSECSENGLVNATVTQLFGTQETCKLALIEAGCTDTSASLARTHWANQLNVPQITCSSTAQDNMNVFEVSPSSDVIVPALMELITRYNWTKLALVVEDKQEYTQIVNPQSLRTPNVSLTVLSAIVRNDTLKVEESTGANLFDSSPEIRIFMLSMSSKMASKFLCEAFKSGIQYPKYEFIFVNDHGSDWWVASPQDDTLYGCSTEQRAQVLNFSLALQWNLKHSNDHVSKGIPDNLLNTRALYCYDTIWVLAQALNHTALSDEYCTSQCIYSNQQLANEYHKRIQNTSFSGVTGDLAFTEKRGRVDPHRNVEVLIAQYRTSMGILNHSSVYDLKRVGLYHSGILTFTNTSSLWPRGRPYDGTPVNVTVTVSGALVAVYYVIAILGIILSIVCCAFNFVFRNTKIVRLTSPNLNYLIITGVILGYISTFLYILPSTNHNVVLASCIFQAGILGNGNVLVIGTIVAKLWRIYYIFRNPDSSKKHTITDCHLFFFVLVLFGIMFLITLVYGIAEVAFLDMELMKLPNKENPSGIVGEREVTEQYEYYTCYHTPYVRTVIICLIFGVIGVLLGCALYMAFKTRKVRIKGLNDAKYITAIVYILSLALVLFIIFTFTLEGYVNIFPAARNGLLLLSITVVLGLVFIPKMINLYRDPNGEHVFSYSNTHCPGAQPSTMFVNKAECNGCQDLKTRIQTLEKLLEMKDQSIRSEGNNLVLHSTNIGFHQDAGFSSTSQDDTADDHLEETVEVNFEDGVCAYHVSHKV